MSDVEINSQFEQVLNFINQTNQSVFLTGKAGTGKTTLLKYIKENTFKQMAVLAPTGVASINAGGSTIHSFFQFAFAPFLPTLNLEGNADFSKLSLANYKYNNLRLSIFRKLELLVIDEISMVRADLLDQIDFVLRATRRKTHLPFGGVQLLYIGDMHQLPPVVNKEEWQLLNNIYQSPYFFDSLVFKKNPAVFIELEKIYRQNEQEFIDLLNKVRNNNIDLIDLDKLNSHYSSTITNELVQNCITLTTHNQKADEINIKQLTILPKRVYSFKCKVEGVFSEKNFPADENLQLKVGAKVMFLKNNSEKNYYNGKIGVVTFVNESEIKIKCEEDNFEIDVEKEVWTNVTYKLNNQTKVLEEEILGTFSQYPLRLAWAITIHKSQGLTFNKVIIDAANSFSAGQVYVALSRCRSLKGLTLSSKINSETLFNDRKIVSFSLSNKKNQNAIDAVFNSSKQDFIRNILMGLFDLSEIIFSRKELAGFIQLYKSKLNTTADKWSTDLFLKLDTLNEISLKFKNQLQQIFVSSVNLEHDQNVIKRIGQACVYFNSELESIIILIKNIPFTTESKEAAEGINNELQTLFDLIFTKNEIIKSCTYGFNLYEFLKAKLKIVYPPIKINVYATAKNSKISGDITYPVLYKKLLLLRDEICNEEHKPIYMVANNKSLKELTEFLPVNIDQLMRISGFGEVKVQLFGDKFLAVIKDYMFENNLTSNMPLESTIKTKKADQEIKAKKKVSEKKSDSKEQTFNLFKEGLSLDEISIMRGLTLSTLENHLLPYIEKGEINVDFLVTPDKQKTILMALQKYNKTTGLNPIKMSVPQDISFSEIKFVLALKNRNDKK